ncbi:hypothetical protein DENSPDRAFT_644457 [Dentipellis sp. KUC8613]|nr:hypothetical protein DENSPDRAFT_644457 [Dentipellis sp. KUC8613]
MSNQTAAPPTIQLPNSLNLPPHLSAHKYFFVCTLTILAWDTIVLSPRTWRLLRFEGWPVLKAMHIFLTLFLPIEFAIVGVAFFDPSWSQSMCQKFYLFEPICTAIILAVCSTIHAIRIHAIYDRNRTILAGMSALVGIQIVATAISCAFYRSVPLLSGQGCIAGPKHLWVGIYWLSATIVYTASFAFALIRSIQSLELKRLSPWKLMLRDGLNLYAAIWIVNMVNMLFWFIEKPTDGADPIRTIVTSMAAVMTTTMTQRIVLSVRGPLYSGGTFSGALTSGTSSGTRPGTARTGPNGAPQLISQMHGAPLYTIDGITQKTERSEWIDGSDIKSGSLHEGDLKEAASLDPELARPGATSPVPGVTPALSGLGVKITIEREMALDPPVPESQKPKKGKK